MKGIRSVLVLLGVLGAFVIAASPAAAAPQQEGLVNVNVSDVQVGLPIAIAADVCDVAVNVLARQQKTGGAECDSTAESGAVFEPGNGGGDPQQNGLVNVNVSDVTVKVPISVAANVCDVAVNVLSEQLKNGGATCDAVAGSSS